ncbi:MAG: molybdenum cofactor guanylyltransferase [Dehalococcoidia bacterium]|nr:molybdenum cofactor guanylyltransferase [Dehalococcoidia bacterium]
MTSIILAGGKSLRFGQGKALETIAGKSLIRWVIDRLTPLSREIIVVTSQTDCFPWLAANTPLSPKIIADIYPGKGPLGGIYTGLTALTSSHAVVAGCDMPFLNAALLDYMIQISPVADIVVPRIGTQVEPLCAVYSKNCLAPIHNLLERNELKLSTLFNITRVKYVEEDEVNRLDPEHLSFFNINTQADLDEARKLAVAGWME